MHILSQREGWNKNCTQCWIMQVCFNEHCSNKSCTATSSMQRTTWVELIKFKICTHAKSKLEIQLDQIEKSCNLKSVNGQTDQWRYKIHSTWNQKSKLHKKNTGNTVSFEKKLNMRFNFFFQTYLQNQWISQNLYNSKFACIFQVGKPTQQNHARH